MASGSYQAYMRSVGLKILKNKLSEYVRLAAGGETVLITDRDRVVACRIYNGTAKISISTARSRWHTASLDAPLAVPCAILFLLLMEPLILGLGSNVYNIMRRYTRQRNMAHAHKYRNR